MRVRIRNGLLCIFSLLIGGIIYLLFRPTTILSEVIGSKRLLQQLRVWLQPISNAFVWYYVGDFLWMLALCCGGYTILLLNQKQERVWISAAVLLGVIWELMQWLGVVRGTGDWLDIFMYALGGFASKMINRKEKKE